MKPKTKFNLLTLVWAVGLLFPFLTVFDRTFASQYVGSAVGFGLGLLLYPPTGLPFLVYSWLTRHWNALRATVVATVLYLPFLFYMWRGLSYLGDDIDFVSDVGGTAYALLVGIVLLQLLFTFLTFAFSKTRGSRT